MPYKSPGVLGSISNAEAVNDKPQQMKDVDKLQSTIAKTAESDGEGEQNEDSVE